MRRGCEHCGGVAEEEKVSEQERSGDLAKRCRGIQDDRFGELHCLGCVAGKERIQELEKEAAQLRAENAVRWQDVCDMQKAKDSAEKRAEGLAEKGQALAEAATQLCRWIRHTVPEWTREVEKYLELTDAALSAWDASRPKVERRHARYCGGDALCSCGTSWVSRPGDASKGKAGEDGA